MTNQKQKKSNQVNLDILVQQPGQMRMDVTGSAASLYLASFVLNEEQFQYLIIRERQYFSGAASDMAMQKLMAIPIHPRVILDILFDRPLPKQDWDCHFGKKNQYCENKKSTLKVEWIPHENPDKLILAISSDKVRADLSLDLVSKNAVLPDNAFELKQPQGFQIVE